MTKSINQIEMRFPEDRDELIRVAIESVDTCVSVGGLAEHLGMLQAPPIPISAPSVGAKAFAKLVQFWRRKQRLSVEDLASKAGLTQAEVLEAEQGDTVPEPRVLYALSEVLQVSYEKLLLLTNQVKVRNESVVTAAIQFAARSEPMEGLSKREEEALHEFIQALVD